jgi:hypothetical protein
MTAEATTLSDDLSLINSENLKDLIVVCQEKLKREGIRPVEHKRPEPGFVAIFASWEQMEIWLFCMQQRVTLSDYKRRYKELHGRDIDANYLKQPDSVFAGKDHRENIGMYRKVNAELIEKAGLEDRKMLKAWCRICHGTGFAHIIRSSLIHDDIPGKLATAICWCRR